jgi:PAS domain S-box-containing protein
MSSDTPTPVPLTDRTFRKVLLFFTLILAVIVGIAVITLRNLSRSVATSDWVNHTHALITEVDALRPTLAAAEGELARYLLTSDPRDQAAYQEKFADLAENVAVINALIANSATEKELFAPVAALLARRADLANQAVRLKKAGDTEGLRKLQAGDAEGNDPAELARLVEKLRAQQTDLLSARDRTSFVQTQMTRWTVLAGVGFNFLLLCGAAWLIRDDLAARRHAARLLAQTNAELEDKVRVRTAEIAAVNAQLTAQNLEERWAKQAIEHQNRYNLLIIDSITDAVFVVTKLMNISRMNPAAVHLTGFEPVDLVDKPLTRVAQLADSDPTRRPFDPVARTLAEGHDMRNQAAVLTTKNGERQTILLSVYPLRDRDKVVGGVVILKPSAPIAS